jgi:hypothetical protein
MQEIVWNYSPMGTLCWCLVTPRVYAIIRYLSRSYDQDILWFWRCHNVHGNMTNRKHSNGSNACQVPLKYYDFTKPFDIFTDASNYQLGAIISQDGWPVQFYSRKIKLSGKRSTFCYWNLTALSPYSFGKHMLLLLWPYEFAVSSLQVRLSKATQMKCLPKGNSKMTSTKAIVIILFTRSGD